MTFGARVSSWARETFLFHKNDIDFSQRMPSRFKNPTTDDRIMPFYNLTANSFNVAPVGEYNIPALEYIVVPVAMPNACRLLVFSTRRPMVTGISLAKWGYPRPDPGSWMTFLRNKIIIYLENKSFQYDASNIKNIRFHPKWTSTFDRIYRNRCLEILPQVRAALVQTHNKHYPSLVLH